MSAKDAPGEVDNNNFGSPNISSAEEEEIKEVDKAAEEQKKRETVEIDGIPIEDKEIKYKAEDIKKMKKMNYFVNVEGAEERAKAAAKKKEAEKRAAEKQAEDEKREAEREAKEAKAKAEKDQAAEKQHIEDVKNYIKEQKAKKARDEKREENSERREKLYNLFWKGKRKIFTLIIPVSVILIIVIASFVITSINNAEAEDKLIAEALAEAQSMEEMPFRQAVLEIDNNEILDNALVNYNFDEVDGIYDKIIKKMTENIDIARVYMDKAYRIMDYHPEEVERIVRAAELAYSYAPDELEIANNLYGIYMFADMPDKAAEIDEKLQRINLKFQAEAGESQ